MSDIDDEPIEIAQPDGTFYDLVNIDWSCSPEDKQDWEAQHNLRWAILALLLDRAPPGLTAANLMETVAKVSKYVWDGKHSRPRAVED